MNALVTFALCAVVPWLLCQAIRAVFFVGPRGSALSQERALIRYRRTVLRFCVVLLPASAIAGALTVDPALATRWPTAGSWFFATICATTTWVSVSLAQQTRDEVAAMPLLETVGRSLQMASLPATAVALSLLSVRGVEMMVWIIPPVRAVLAALLSVFALFILGPWLVMLLGLWRLLPSRIEAHGSQWRLAHLPVPNPFLTHAAAIPWLRTVFVTDALFQRAPDAHWRALVRYEIGGARAPASNRAARWSLTIPLALVVYMAGAAVGSAEPRKLVAATVLAVAFTAVVSWFANREPASRLSMDTTGPTMQELAQTLRSLPPAYGQAMPRTAHRPLGSALYDRLYALGHDPGRRARP